MIDLKLDPREVQRAIRELEHVDLAAATIEELEARLVPLFRGYRAVAPKFDPGVYLYRGRKCAKPTRLSEITYPPSHLVSAIGRANGVGQSMFYAATARAVPFFELGVGAGDFLALSRWKTVSPFILNHVGFSSEPGSFGDAKRNLDKVYKFVSNTRGHGDLNALVYDYLAYAFARPVKGKEQLHYKLTTAISRKMLSGSFIHGLLYPTIEMSGNADNVVLKKESADRHLEFVSAEYILVKEVRGSQFNIEILDSAARVDLVGTLFWSIRGLQWSLNPGEELTLVVEGGEFIAYDPSGARVDPA
jgi:hypothetical protein